MIVAPEEMPLARTSVLLKSSAELPVKREIWKFGSPHTLVLTKTDELFRREAKARKDATASLEWLAAQRRR